MTAVRALKRLTTAAPPGTPAALLPSPGLSAEVTPRATDDPVLGRATVQPVGAGRTGRATGPGTRIYASR